jgi:nucleoside-diphosphate kinase
MERTLSIIKPDAVANNNIGAIINIFEQAGLAVVAAKMVHLSQMQAEDFYAIHKARPFFGDLVRFMISGPVLVMALEGPDAVARNRELMGATNPKDAAPGTIRALFAKTIDENAIHGSDSQENAANEIEFFFNTVELCVRTR